MLYNNGRLISYVRSDNRKYENDKEKCMRFFRKVFIKVKLEKIGNGVIILIPEYKRYSKRIKKILEKQLNSYMQNKKIDYCVFEEELKFLEQYNNNKNTLNGKLLMKDLLLKILEYIFNSNKQNMNLENIYVFVNNYTKNNIYIIKKLVSKFKTVNIITENLKYYRRLEESLYNEGILITVSNNKRKSARNAKYIINMDFEKELFEKYNINMNSFIINLTNELIFFENTFNGVLINDFRLCINEDGISFVNEFYGNFTEKIYLESLLCSGMEYFEKADELYEQYNGKITELIGIRGVLQKCEFLV